MKRVGLTGPTGAGKSTALAVLRDMGGLVLDADEVYHELLETSEPMKTALIARFGRDILDESGKIDRRRLSGVVYDGGLDDLNAITHKFVIAELDRRVAASAAPFAAIDAINLIESGVGDACDATVAVLAPAELRLKRVMARDGVDESYARRRIAAQPGDDFYRKSCGHVLENRAEDTPESFQARARALFREILAG